MLLLQSEIPSGMRAKLRTVAASNNRDHAPRSLYLCLFGHLYMGVVLRAHSIRGKPRIQRNVNGEVATTVTTYLPFCNEPHRSHVVCVKAAPGTTFTSWSQNHFVAIGKPERQVRKASHTVAASNNRDHTPRSLYFCLFTPLTYGLEMARAAHSPAFGQSAKGFETVR